MLLAVGMLPPRFRSLMLLLEPRRFVADEVVWSCVGGLIACRIELVEYEVYPPLTVVTEEERVRDDSGDGQEGGRSSKVLSQWYSAQSMSCHHAVFLLLNHLAHNYARCKLVYSKPYDGVNGAHVCSTVPCLG